MISQIYVEQELEKHPKVQNILARFPRALHSLCTHYGEIFNRKCQNFRMQKQDPALILAKKTGRFVLPTPEHYGIGHEKNYYFSHLLNCVFDCRYCYLQGMYNSAHYVHFINEEDCYAQIEQTIEENHGKSCAFFSGYDCDSLALESITGFAQRAVGFFKNLYEQGQKDAFLELRTKSANTSFLLKMQAVPNVIVAYTLSPHEIAQSLEHKAPSLEKRLHCLKSLAQASWPIALRLDPIIFCDHFETVYGEFFKKIFQTLPVEKIHSVSCGTFRMPKKVFQKAKKLYPREPLFAQSYALCKSTGSAEFGYEKETLNFAQDFCEKQILSYISKEQFFPCYE